MCVWCFQLVLTMGNYMNKGNMRIGAAAGFKIEYLNKVRLAGSLHGISVVTRQYVVVFCDFSETLLFEIRAICFKLLLINVLSLIFSFSIFRVLCSFIQYFLIVRTLFFLLLTFFSSPTLRRQTTSPRCCTF